jgi:putative hydrolase of HD superfamily
MPSARLAAQLRFIAEIDKVKQVVRRTLLVDGSRLENDAEHSWHLAVMAVLLAEYAAGPGVDAARVVRMVLVHDLVEIDAGDTYCYDAEANLGRESRERAAAERIFGLLPADQAAEVRALWEEFEARETPEARFAAALDRFQPLYHNFLTEGRQWRKYGVTRGMIMQRNAPIADGAPGLWQEAVTMVDLAVERGYAAP